MCWEKKKVGTFRQRKPLMKKALTKHGADVIGVQECKPMWERFLNRNLRGFDSIIKYRSKTSKEATPIYWRKDKFEKLDGGHFWLSETPDVEGSIGWDAKCSRVTSWVLLRDIQSQKEFVFVNTHLDHVGELARINGVKLICKFIRDKIGESMPLILVGDFNAWPDSETIRNANKLLCDARAAAKESTNSPTFHAYGDENRRDIIDYIYISQNIRCNTFNIVKETKRNSYQSDHYGIIADLDIV